jgi:sodium-dependent dicarboxylate transporter 2/3/5
MSSPHAPKRADSASHVIQEAIEHPSDYGFRQWSGWILGPAILILTCLVDPPSGLSEAGWRTAGAASLMAVLWMTEAIPIPVTALLPLVLFPALQLSDIRDAATPYANPLIFLFLGGFIIALAMQRWNLHRRVAVKLIGAMGTRPTRLVAGFLLASSLVSMWVSNTATALMMLPIALSVVQLLPSDTLRTPAMRSFGTALMLSVAYGATTGGMATLIGTPPNALLAGYLGDVYHYKIGFGQWMLLGVPVMLVTLPLVYWVLTRVSFRLSDIELPGAAELIATEKARLGRFSRGEFWVALVFGCTAVMWMFQPIIAKWLPLVSDTTIAMLGAIVLFLIPINVRRGEFVMTWEATKGLPWEVLLLFGGGLSLAGNIEKHGLASYLGTLSAGLDGVPVIAAVAAVCFGILLLTELTSNTATAATFLPIAASIAIGMGENPLLFVIPTALAANCSYMLPVGTPPNAIVFGSGLIRLPEMARAGMLLNILLVPVIVTLVWLIGRFVFDIELGVLPEWAMQNK